MWNCTCPWDYHSVVDRTSCRYCDLLIDRGSILWIFWVLCVCYKPPYLRCLVNECTRFCLRTCLYCFYCVQILHAKLFVLFSQIVKSMPTKAYVALLLDDSCQSFWEIIENYCMKFQPTVKSSSHQWQRQIATFLSPLLTFDVAVVLIGRYCRFILPS